MNKKELEFSNLLLKMSNEILDYIKKYGLKSFDTYKNNKEKYNEENNIDIEQQEEFLNVDNSKVELVNSQKEQKSIIPLLIGGWILYKILK